MQAYQGKKLSDDLIKFLNDKGFENISFFVMNNFDWCYKNDGFYVEENGKRIVIDEQEKFAIVDATVDFNEFSITFSTLKEDNDNVGNFIPTGMTKSFKFNLVDITGSEQRGIFDFDDLIYYQLSINGTNSFTIIEESPVEFN